ncbi:MAG: hypothetical protein NTY42_10565 [Planctomycetota bacterium]|nr:hypothetical protein [Planctomycetota bacterium]
MQEKELREFRDQCNAAKNAWRTAEEICTYDPDAELNRLRGKAISLGLNISAYERIVPVGKSIVDVALSDWIDIPGAQEAAWNRFQVQVAYLLYAADEKGLQANEKQEVNQLGLPGKEPDVTDSSQNQKTKPPEPVSGELSPTPNNEAPKPYGASEDGPEMQSEQVVVPESEKGISLYDIGLHFEKDELAARSWVKRFSDSKKNRCEPIGKCPNEGRASLYRLSEIVLDVQNYLNLDGKEKAKLSQAMQHRLRSKRL